MRIGFSGAGYGEGVTSHIAGIDAAHVWHPYGAFPPTTTPLVVESAQGTRITLADGRELVDAMTSWWTAIHGHGHPVLDAAITAQLATMNHVMFGGLTHEPAARLAQLLVEITPDGLDTVFFSDSGSVSVEVAVKMALQYWRSLGRRDKHRLMTWRGGYHGDTFTPMSVCDPDGGMHSLWTDVLAHQVFAPQVPTEYDPAYSAGVRNSSWPSTPTNWPPSSSNPSCRARAACGSTTRATWSTCARSATATTCC